MTEQEWLQCNDREKMLCYLQDRAGKRKLQMFACACCRSIWHKMTDERFRRAIEIAEKCADGKGELREFMAKWNDLLELLTDKEYEATSSAWASWACMLAIYTDPFRAAWNVTEYIASGYYFGERRISDAEIEQAVTLRDIIGNPFRPITLGPSWLTPTVKTLAQTIYDDRTFDRLLALADALEEAGCHDADILSHCRGSGVHTRGCWVVDLAMGKE